MDSINIPEELVRKWKETWDQQHAWREKQEAIFREIEGLNEKFFRNCRDRIRRRLKGIDYQVHARIAHGGKPFALVSLSIYLGHPNKNIKMDCYVKELSDINQMCKEAQVMVKAFREEQDHGKEENQNKNN